MPTNELLADVELLTVELEKVRGELKAEQDRFWKMNERCVDIEELYLQERERLSLIELAMTNISGGVFYDKPHNWFIVIHPDDAKAIGHTGKTLIAALDAAIASSK